MSHHFLFLDVPLEVDLELDLSADVELDPAEELVASWHHALLNEADHDVS